MREWEDRVAMAVDLDKVTEIYDEICKLGLLEDRREYDARDLLESNPGLSSEEAAALHFMIQQNFR
jgi:hypothetical protein